MGKKITLVNEDANPSEYTTSDPTTITQLKSQGYTEKPDAGDEDSGPADTAAGTGGTEGTEGAGAAAGTPASPAKPRGPGNSRVGEK